MTQHYVFFARDTLPQPAAHLVQVTHSANAAANLGYSAVLCYLNKGLNALNPIDLINPHRLRKPTQQFIEFYNVQDKLRVLPLSMPWPVDQLKSTWTNSSTIACKYYFPIHIFPKTKLVHSRDWNFVKAAIKNGVPAIYEHQHHDSKHFEPEIVRNPLLQVAVTPVDTVRDSMIQQGMPAEKAVQLHNGFNSSFLERQPEAAQAWREQLLSTERPYLVVYSGALYRFKGIDLLIDVAKELPQVQVVMAGGNESQVEAYRQLAREKQAPNVKFLGYLPQKQLSSLLQAADILAHPHLSGKAATFTSPLKLFDYMASGTPIVSTEIPPLLEFKSSKAIAGWCEPDNPRQFAQCLLQVLETHPRKVGGYTDNLDFVKQFSWESRIAKILSYVEESRRPPLRESVSELS
jgi:glycosyltransferase involved in cell wall biosynthesis